MNHDPMEHMIESATQVVQEEGYLHADDKAVQLAAVGYVGRQLRELREHIDARFDELDKPASKQKKMADGVKTTGLVGFIVATIEAARMFVG